MRLKVRSLTLLSGLRIWPCHELWCRSQRRLGFEVAVAKAGSYSSNLTYSLGTSICRRCGPTKTKDEKKKKKEEEEEKECKMLGRFEDKTWDFK